MAFRPWSAKRRRKGNNDPSGLCLQSVVHSGHFMSSHVHDTDDIYSLPQLSPNVGGPAAASMTEEIIGNTCHMHVISTKDPQSKFKEVHESGIARIEYIDYDFINLLKNVNAIFRKHVISPKWKNFRGCGLKWLSKIRLNNVIWRAWHQQYVLRYKRSMVHLSTNRPIRGSIDAIKAVNPNDHFNSMWMRENLEWFKTYRASPSVGSATLENYGLDNSQYFLRFNKNAGGPGESTIDSIPFVSACRDDIADTLFSSSWDYPDVYPESYLNAESCQPIIGQMYPEFNFEFFDNSNYPNGIVLVNHNNNNDHKMKENYLEPEQYLKYHGANNYLARVSADFTASASGDTRFSAVVEVTPPPLDEKNSDIFTSHIGECSVSESVAYIDEGVRECVALSDLAEVDRSSKYSSVESAQSNYCLQSSSQTNNSGVSCPGNESALRSDMVMLDCDHTSSALGVKDFSGHNDLPMGASGAVNPSASTEEHRRQLIKMNFMKLDYLLPPSDLHQRKSKATILQTASEMIRDLVSENARYRNRIDQMKERVAGLEGQISELRRQLPECGAVLSGQSSSGGQPIEQLGSYSESARESSNLLPKLLRDSVQRKVSSEQNWPFCILSLMILPMYQSFNETVRLGSYDQMVNSLSQWQTRSLQLKHMRDAAYNTVLKMGHKTSIHTNPSLLPEECKLLALEMLE